MSRINSHSGWQPLREVMLGDVYPAEFYHDHEPEVRAAFEIITEMTKEDLSKIQKLLESKGIRVHRPAFTNNRDDYLDSQGMLIKPPIMPRDTEMVLGRDFYHLRMDYNQDPWQHLIDDMGSRASKIHYAPRSSDMSCLCPPSVVRCGRDIFVDYDTHAHIWHLIAPTFVEWSKNYRVHIVSTGGHSDGVFCPVAPGVIITTHWLDVYHRTFPGWEVYQLEKEVNPGKPFQRWWIDQKEVSPNGLFAKHIEQHALDWVGHYKETQFSVNMLVLDDKCVLAVNENPKLCDFLSTKGIDVVVCDFRCKTFWDGGMHCLTCDIARDGEQQDYFVDRPAINYLEWIV